MNSIQIISAITEIDNYKTDLNNIFTTLSTLYPNYQDIIKKPSSWILYKDKYEDLIKNIKDIKNIGEQNFYYCESTTNTTWTGNKLKYNYTDCKWQKTGLLSTFQINDNLLTYTVTGTDLEGKTSLSSQKDALNNTYCCIRSNKLITDFKYQAPYHVSNLDKPAQENYGIQNFYLDSNFSEEIRQIQYRRFRDFITQCWPKWFQNHPEITGIYFMVSMVNIPSYKHSYISFDSKDLNTCTWGYLSSLSTKDEDDDTTFFTVDKNVKITNNASSFIGHIFNSNMSKELVIDKEI